MSKSSETKKKAARRKVLPGYPIEKAFESIDEVRSYLSGEKIICLLCGKSYRRIGTHIEIIHGMTMDEYKIRYNIPWTYSLICADSSKKYSKAVRKRMDDGWSPPIKIGEEHREMIKKTKRKCPFKGDIALQNLGESAFPKHPLIISPLGELETFTNNKIRMQTKKGTPEFVEKMKNRPQCQPKIVKERIGQYWKGKKQTPEHIEKRFAKNI